MNRPMSREEQERINEELMAKAEPSDYINPGHFAASLTNTVLSVTMPLGMDLRFCRGILSRLGRSPDGFLTVRIAQDETSPYRLGQVHRNDALLDIPTRQVQIPHHKLEVIGISEIPRFSRRRPDRVFLLRIGELQLTFATVRVHGRRRVLG